MSFGRLRSPLGLLAVLAQNFLGALRAQSEGQGNLSMHPQGDNLYGYGPTTHFLAYFRLVLGATNTPPAPRFRPVLGLAAPAAPFGSFGTFRDLGSPEPQNLPRQVLGILADRPPRRPTFRPRAPLRIGHRFGGVGRKKHAHMHTCHMCMYMLYSDGNSARDNTQTRGHAAMS